MTVVVYSKLTLDSRNSNTLVCVLPLASGGHFLHAHCCRSHSSIICNLRSVSTKSRKGWNDWIEWLCDRHSSATESSDMLKLPWWDRNMPWTFAHTDFIKKKESVFQRSSIVNKLHLPFEINHDSAKYTKIVGAPSNCGSFYIHTHVQDKTQNVKWSPSENL